MRTTPLLSVCQSPSGVSDSSSCSALMTGGFAGAASIGFWAGGITQGCEIGCDDSSRGGGGTGGNGGSAGLVEAAAVANPTAGTEVAGATAGGAAAMTGLFCGRATGGGAGGGETCAGAGAGAGGGDGGATSRSSSSRSLRRRDSKRPETETEAQDVERQLRGGSMRMRCPPTENEIDSPAQADVVSTISAARLQSRFIGASHLRDKN